MKKHSGFNNIWTIRHIRDGNVIWEDTAPNALGDEGEEAMLEVFFRSDSVTAFINYQAAYVAAAGNPVLLAIAYANYVAAYTATATYAPQQFYVRLCNDTLLETETLSSVVGEPVGNGYLPQLLERSIVGYPTKEIITGDYRLTSKVLTFGAVGGAIGPVSTAYLATTIDNTGKLICYRALAMTRTILDGDFMTVQMRPRLS